MHAICVRRWSRCAARGAGAAGFHGCGRRCHRGWARRPASRTWGCRQRSRGDEWHGERCACLSTARSIVACTDHSSSTWCCSFCSCSRPQACRLIAETSPRTPGIRRALRPTIAVPAQVREALLIAAPSLIAVWALAGFYGSLGPSLPPPRWGRSRFDDPRRRGAVRARRQRRADGPGLPPGPGTAPFCARRQRAGHPRRR